MENTIVTKYTKMIMSAMKAGNKQEAETYKLVKAKMMEFLTQKNAPVLDESAEANILNKMVKERNDSADIYNKNNRPELAAKELAEACIIEDLLPKAATKEEIEAVLDNRIKEVGPLTQKDMGTTIKWLKTQFTNIDGQLAAQVVKSRIQ